MKKVFFIIVFTALGLFSVKAQVNVIKTDPLFSAAGVINLGYEHQFSKKLSLTLGANHYTQHNTDFTRTNVFGFDAGVRYYILPTGNLSGFYLNPRLQYNSKGVFNLGATFGYQWHWKSNIVLDVAAGPFNYFSVSDFTNQQYNFGVGAGLSVGIGYAF